jgi:cobalt-zinc-cadmium efflux system membrane fusion protein
MNDRGPEGEHIRRTLVLPVKSQLAIVVVVVLAIAALMALMYVLTRSGSDASAAQGTTPAGSFRATPAQWDALKIATVQTLAFSGEIVTDGAVAYDEDTTTPVFSPYSGRVAKLFAKPGDIVAAGAPLLSVDASEFVQGQNDLVAAAAAVDTAKAQLALAEATEKRQHELLLAKAGAEKDWRQSQTDLTAARSALRSAEIALATVRNRLRILGQSDAEIGRIEHAGIQPRGAESIVRAPLAGTVIQRQVGPGQYIQSAAGGASSPVYQIGDLSTVWVVANVRESDAPQLQLGALVEVRTLAWPDRVFAAKLSWIAPAIDAQTHRLPVRAEVDNRDGALKPTMFATIRIVTGAATEAPAVPQRAIVYEGSDAHVYVARDDRLLALRPIRTGRTHGGMVEVAEGLAAGERVVTAGALFIDREVAGD